MNEIEIGCYYKPLKDNIFNQYMYYLTFGREEEPVFYDENLLPFMAITCLDPNTKLDIEDARQQMDRDLRNRDISNWEDAHSELEKEVKIEKLENKIKLLRKKLKKLKG